MTNQEDIEIKSHSFDDKNIIIRSKSAPPRPLNDMEEFKKSKMFVMIE